MRIQHNIPAMSSYRNYTNNTSAVSKNLERLSSGYRINRAGDDAAGLAISEKMRAQITGLNAAQKNAKDGISLVKTAEGALQEVHDMLNRMVNLATQSANGTYDNETDRFQLQKEVNQLRSEINRIADSSNFNGIKLFDGTMEADKITYNIAGDAALAIFDGNGSTDVTEAGTSTILHTSSTAASKTKFVVDLSNVAFSSKNNITDTNADFGISVGGQNIAAAVALNKGDTLGGEDLAKALEAKAATLNGNKGFMISGISYSVKADGSKLVFEMTDKSFDLIKNDSTKKASFTGNFDVAIVQGTAGKPIHSGTINAGTQVIQEGTPKINGNLANTEAAMTTADFADGKTLTVGDVTYVFASKQSTLDMVKEAGGKFVAIDLSDISKDGLLDNTTATGAGYANAFTEAVARLTRAGESNKMFSIGHETTDGTNVTFQEREDYNGNGKGGRADLTTMDGIKAQLRTGTFNKEVIAAAKGSGKGLTLQIGDTADSYNQLNVSLGDMHCASLGIDSISIADQDGAAAAIDAIKNAINQVSDVRGTLGATQNRLDHTINNLSVMTENIQDAESTIRDVDIAEEMMAYTKNNILVQSAQAMLAQANQIPQGVLQLLG